MTDPTPETLAELRWLLAAATPGQWEAEGSQVWGPDGVLVAAVREHSTLVDRPDAELIAAAVNALPALLNDAELLADVRDQVTRGALCPMCSTGSRGHRKCRACIRISQAKYVQNRNRSA